MCHTTVCYFITNGGLNRPQHVVKGQLVQGWSHVSWPEPHVTTLRT